MIRECRREATIVEKMNHNSHVILLLMTRVTHSLAISST
jgi:hypothetical protein